MKRLCIQSLGLVLGILLNISAFAAVEKRPIELSLTTSVIIPCMAKHAHFLPQLLRSYATQTVLPDEIVISLGSIECVSREIVDELNSGHWPFPVKLLYSSSSFPAGENRNRACREAMGDIFILQDADDIPHPQRIEVIKYYFDYYNIDHLMHGYVIVPYQLSRNASHLHVDQLPSITSIDQLEWYIPKSHDTNSGANGVIAIARHIFEKIQWTSEPVHGEDVLFNIEAYKVTEDRIVLKFPLYVYFVMSN